MLRSVRRSIAASPDFALVLDPTRADHVVRVQINDLDTVGAGRVSGTFGIHRLDGDRELDADFSIEEVLNDALIDGAFARVLAASADRIIR